MGRKRYGFAEPLKTDLTEVGKRIEANREKSKPQETAGSCAS